MKRVDTQLNEKQFREFEKRVKQLGETRYSITKKLILNWMKNERAHEIDVAVAYWFLIYAVAIATVITVFSF